MVEKAKPEVPVTTGKTPEGPVTETSDQPPEAEGFTLLRIVGAFWILGLCNNYIYVIMLSAAHDIIHKVEVQEGIVIQETYEESGEGRNCTQLTTGAILLADILPTLFVKLVCPFLPFYVHFRLLLSVATGIISLVVVATSKTILLAIVGVCFASFNSGLGEITLLAYSTNFVLHAIAGWSSGTGAAGLVGSLAYAGMAEVFSPETSLFVSITIPVLTAVSFWVILEHPPAYRNILANNPTSVSEPRERITKEAAKRSIREKVRFLPKLLPFMIPVGLVYYFEYLINSGLFDKFEFHNTTLTKHSQFRWYNAMYQIGVFLSRSSVTWIHFKRIWIMSLLQGLNFVVFFLESIYGFIPNIWIMFALIFWEGLLGGAAYVNTFYNMSYMIEKKQRLFALSIASVADTIGIVLSGATTFPIHDFICKLPFKPLFRSIPDGDKCNVLRTGILLSGIMCVSLIAARKLSQISTDLIIPKA